MISNMSDESETNPRYLRFLRSLVVGSALASIPLAAAACDMNSDCDDCESTTDATTADATTDASVVVDGPLPPPDLPKLV